MIETKTETKQVYVAVWEKLFHSLVVEAPTSWTNEQIMEEVRRRIEQDETVLDEPFDSTTEVTEVMDNEDGELKPDLILTA